MTKEEIIRMAQEAKLRPNYDAQVSAIERFAALVAAAERERACRIVTGLCISDNNAREINEAIREGST